ncbi:MAG TPA: DHH family phosphoesterase, partial [Candidatus Cloacimonadota bacterium]|nr:DHH family phosphoesterase [Candidatus Cloacimonadota bacterium]
MVNRWRIPESEGRNLFEQILHNRQLQAEDLRGGLESLPDEALLANIEQVALRITKALRNNEPMVIFGHDDPDGITSTYILYQYLNSCGYQRHHYYIPNRNLEPHGIQQSLIDFVKNGGYTLVVTVDNGISAAWGVNELNKVGAEVLITDHHLIQ